MRTVRCLVVLAAALGLVMAGCGKKEPPAPPTTPSEAQERAAELNKEAGRLESTDGEEMGQAAAQRAMAAAQQNLAAAKDQFVTSMQGQLNDLGAKIQALQTAPTPSGQSETYWAKTKADLNGKLAKAQSQLQSVMSATPENLNSVKKDFTDSLDDLNSAYADAVKKTEQAPAAGSTAPMMQST